MTSKISVIIPIYNALDDVKKCLESLKENFNFSLGNVCLINDCSNSETSEYLAKYSKANKEFKLLNNEENLGFVKTCNKGMKLAENGIVVLLNSDTKIPKEFCERIVKCFESDEKIGVASPVSSHTCSYYIPLPKGYTLEKMNKKLREKHKCCYPLIPAAEGFCFCIRKEVIKQQGYLDEIFGKGYHEEVDFAYRAITNGWKNVLIDDLYVYHKRQASFGKEQREKLITQNNPVFYHRWSGFRENYCRENNLKNPIRKIEREMFPVKIFLKRDNKDDCPRNFGERIFSIKNTKDKRHKVLTIVGFNVKFNKNKNVLKNLLTEIKFKLKTKRNKKVIYTCITGQYDNLIQHKFVNYNWDYICLTDNEQLLRHKQIGMWKILPIKYTELDNTKNARWHKTHPHILFPEYDESIWVDGNINVLTDKLFNVIKEKSSHANILIPIHFCRQCIYEECDEVIKLNKDTPLNVNNVKKFMTDNNMPKNYGLNETNIIWRKHHSKSIILLMEQWFEYIKLLSKRDQLSLSYVLWKNKIAIDSIAIENARLDNTNYSILKHPTYAQK